MSADTRGIRERLEEIKGREAKATKGPWRAIFDSGSAWIESEKDTVLPFFPPANGANVDFIKHSRADIPWLVEQLEEALRKIERLEKSIEAPAMSGKIRELAEQLFGKDANQYHRAALEGLTAFAESIVEQCCGDVCEMCRNGHAAELDENGLWCHPKAYLTGAACKAAAIRSRWQRGEQEEAGI